MDDTVARVLHVYRTYFPDPPGGLQEAIRQICLATTKLGVENRIFTLSDRPEPRTLTRQEAVVYRYPLHFEIASSGFSLGAFSGFRALTSWADVVHYHFPWPFADLLHLLARVPRPTVVTYHSDIIRQQGLLQIYKPLMWRFLRGVDRIVATSGNYAETSPVLRTLTDKLCIIPLGLDQASYPECDGRLTEELEARYGRDFFVFIGVLRYYKGLSYLLEAMKGTDLRVVIAGTGPEEAGLKEMAQALGLTGVRFAGQVDDRTKVALIQLSRAMVFPSSARSEAFGVSLLEAAMLQRPMITTEIGTGTSYVNLDGETGLVVAPSDPRALRDAMCRLDGDPGLAEHLGIAARRRFEKLFSADTMGRQYLGLYRDLTGQQGARAAADKA